MNIAEGFDAVGFGVLVAAFAAFAMVQGHRRSGAVGIVAGVVFALASGVTQCGR